MNGHVQHGKWTGPKLTWPRRCSIISLTSFQFAFRAYRCHAVFSQCRSNQL